MAISVSVFREILSEFSHDNGDSLPLKKVVLENDLLFLPQYWRALEVTVVTKGNVDEIVQDSFCGQFEIQ